MRKGYLAFLVLLMSIIIMSSFHNKSLGIQIFETSADGQKLQEVNPTKTSQNPITIVIDAETKFQTITGFGGSFTESSAYLLNKVSKQNRNKILEAYFGERGARYSLTRTHINSCDFSLSNYSYAPVENDQELKHFSIKEDMDDIIPMIKDAQKVSKEGFKIISSPWTAPPWMKDNKDWRGGKLLPEYYPVWANFFDKYIDAYKKEGIDIWGITVENEPLGNGKNWESMHFSPEEMNEFVKNYLGPVLRTQHPSLKILGYDQNRDELKEWVDVMYDDTEAKKYFDGTAIHWYASTYDYFPDILQYTHAKAPEKYMIQTEACVDAEVPAWKNDAWYWSKEATDWGWDWAPADKKYLHPKYAPAHRYARDIIGCLNNWVDGWIDWNMVLDRQGGPNWFKNWCTAPVIVDTEKDEVYFTPLYYVMSHFSRFIRPEAVRIGVANPNTEVMCTAALNKDGSTVVILFNPDGKSKDIALNYNGKSINTHLKENAIQTILIH